MHNQEEGTQNPYLLLWLEAPLQSWGFDSRYGRRESLDFPTKSGVLGLLCCAMGAGGEQVALLERLASLDMVVEAYARAANDGTAVAREPLLRDFHMVGSGYDDQDPWQSLLIPRTSTGKKAVGGGAKMTYRYYLQEMAFAVVLEVPSDLVSDLTIALQNPVWDLFLGRKCCVPTEFIYQGLFDGVEQARTAAGDIAKAKSRVLSFLVKQGGHEGEVLTLNDVPVQFGVNKKYRDRRVTVIA